MPKDEFDWEDPFELNGMALLTREDTTREMAECFVEEFIRMGYHATQILALFRDPHYHGPHLAYAKQGEPFLRQLIADVFARRGKAVPWSTRDGDTGPRVPGSAGLPEPMRATDDETRPTPGPARTDPEPPPGSPGHD